MVENAGESQTIYPWCKTSLRRNCVYLFLNQLFFASQFDSGQLVLDNGHGNMELIGIYSL